MFSPPPLPALRPSNPIPSSLFFPRSPLIPLASAPRTSHTHKQYDLYLYVDADGWNGSFYLGYGVELYRLEVLHPLPPSSSPALPRLPSPPSLPLITPSGLVCLSILPFPFVAHSPNKNDAMLYFV